MADVLILTSLDGSPRAEQILDAFEQRTGLRGEATSQGRLYDLSVVEHEVEVVQTLTAIDPAWTDRVGLQDPG